MAHSVGNHDGRADFIKSILDVEVKEMPKTKALGVYADRKEAVRRVINVGLARSGLTGKDLDRRNPRKAESRRRNNPVGRDMGA